MSSFLMFFLIFRHFLLDEFVQKACKGAGHRRFRFRYRVLMSGDDVPRSPTTVPRRPSGLGDADEEMLFVSEVRPFRRPHMTTSSIAHLRNICDFEVWGLNWTLLQSADRLWLLHSNLQMALVFVASVLYIYSPYHLSLTDLVGGPTTSEVSQVNKANKSSSLSK